MISQKKYIVLATWAYLTIAWIGLQKHFWEADVLHYIQNYFQ